MVEELIEQFQMMTPFLIMLTGLAIGLEHAFEPDHIAAVSTQIAKRKFQQSKSLKVFVGQSTLRSSLLGALWGAGHTSTLILVGLLVFALSLSIPDTIFMGLEFIVGIMLVFLGSMTYLNKSIFKFRHLHPHIHEDGTIHTHPHVHDGEHKHGHKLYAIGCVHGLAGSGSLVVLVASSLSSVEMVLSFILIFGIGSVIGMAMISGLIGLPFVFTANITKINRVLRYVAGTASLLIGINIMYEIGIIENLFSIRIF